MNPVRRSMPVLALLVLAGCASGAQHKSFDVRVFEQRGRSRGANVNGQHAFLVRITNQSEEPVAVDSIEVDPQTSSLQFYENAVAVDDTLQPGETRDITVWLTVNAVALNYVLDIDSVDVAITARSASRGTFTELNAATVIAQ